MNEENKKLLLEAGVDLDRTMERFMNNEGLYLKFLKRFPEDPNFAQMKENIAGGQYEEAFQECSYIKRSFRKPGTGVFLPDDFCIDGTAEKQES